MTRLLIVSYSYIILIVINHIPFLYLRLADEDEIIGTDWAEMGERAYGYLPFEESNTPPSRSSDENNANVVIDTRSQSSHTKRNPYLSKVRKLLMIDKTTIVKGVPNLIEQPVLDYSQQKDLGNYRLGSIQHQQLKPTGGDLLQTNSTKVDEEKQKHEPVKFDHHPINYNVSGDTILEGSSSSSGSSPAEELYTSSNNSEKIKEKQ